MAIDIPRTTTWTSSLDLKRRIRNARRNKSFIFFYLVSTNIKFQVLSLKLRPVRLAHYFLCTFFLFLYMSKEILSTSLGFSTNLRVLSVRKKYLLIDVCVLATLCDKPNDVHCILSNEPRSFLQLLLFCRLLFLRTRSSAEMIFMSLVFLSLAFLEFTLFHTVT